MSQRQATFGDLELQILETLTQLGGALTTYFRESKNRMQEITNQNQQLMADLAKEKVKNSKEPEPKVIKSNKK